MTKAQIAEILLAEIRQELREDPKSPILLNIADIVHERMNKVPDQLQRQITELPSKVSVIRNGEIEKVKVEVLTEFQSIRNELNNFKKIFTDKIFADLVAAMVNKALDAVRV